MNYRRPLLIVLLDGDARGALAMVRRAAPRAERLLIVACLPTRNFAWLSSEAPPALHEQAATALEALRAQAQGAAPLVDIELMPTLSFDALDELAAAAQIDLLVTMPLPLGGVATAAQLRERRAVAVLWVPDGSTPPPGRALGELVCVALGERARTAVAAFLRDHAEPGQRVTVLQLAGPVPPDLASAVAVAGIRADVAFVVPQGRSSQQWLDERLRTQAPDLVVYARVPATLLLGRRWTVPGLLLPPPAAVSRPLLQLELDAPDLLADGGALRARFEYASGLGWRTAIPDQAVAWVSGGQVVAVLATRAGECELPAGLQADRYGVFRSHGGDLSFPLARLEQRISVIRRPAAPLVLFDAELAPPELAALGALAARGPHELLAVRLRPLRSCRAIRARLQAAGLAPRVVDARLVLAEGEALDVPDLADAVRLARVATRLRAAGWPLAAIVHRAAAHPVAQGYRALRAAELAALAALPPAVPATAAEPLEATTAAALIAGNRVELELDNTVARRWLLEAIAAATRRIHLQVYMANDDDVGREVEAALRQAAARGVRVGLLVDSLHGMHGSLGAVNPLLQRLGAQAGIELRVSRPITSLPTLEDLKQRDHRKLVVVDNRLALLGGRNLAHEYYTGFDEVRLTPQSPWREVPWLDAGARLQGPAVAVLERAFLAAWRAAGGTPFEVVDSAAAGDTPVRTVMHHGLRDATTLEAYLAIIASAQQRLDVVHGFPLVLEIQHALLRALQRGVRLRLLFGHLTPTHAGAPFQGPWSSARTAMTALVHSRIDALIAAGAEGYLFTVAQRPGWAPGLGPIQAHVHAKAISADGRRCALGSANMDVTGGYWESELLLVVEDAAQAAGFEARIDALIAGSVRVARDDPQWQAMARSRQWLRYWPGVLAL